MPEDEESGYDREEVDRLAQERHDEIERDIEWFLVTLLLLLKNWQTWILHLIEDLPSSWGNSRKAELGWLEQQLANKLGHPVDLGEHGVTSFPALVEEFLARYHKAEPAAEAVAEAAGIPEDELGELDSDELAALKAIDRRKIASEANDAAATIAQTVVASSIAGLAQTDIHAAIEGNILHFVRNVSLAAEGLVAYDRLVNWFRFQTADAFEWAGPKDERNRPICAQHAQKVWSRAYLDKLDNGFPAPYSDIWTYAGGIRCRHRLTPSKSKPVE